MFLRFTRGIKITGIVLTLEFDPIITFYGRVSMHEGAIIFIGRDGCGLELRPIPRVMVESCV
jgi:hypothetical protein